ncbi:PAS domain S-box protein [Bacillus sp. SB49]|uniref:sigma 54-interacting transcriptional regulator n=1 Tax=Bacillus sp. SB49 TaxID=1071080 RepID=UPI00040B238E|nr:sigma 54-interacting transcriptional regulator [Bacillus sp. SB49]QHT46058.1 PAS domain S-box protein [Bacillus sp. SB49]
MNEHLYFPLEMALNSLSSGFLIIDRKGMIKFINSKGERLLEADPGKAVQSSIKEWTTEKEGFFFLSEEYQISTIFVGSKKLIVNHSPIFTDEGFFGVSAFFEEEQSYHGLIDEPQFQQSLTSDLKALFDTSYDVIYVSDDKGTTLRVSSACKELWGKEENELVGKNVYDFERDGVFTPSITRLVLEKGESVSVVQTTQTGKKLKVIGTPIRNKAGEVIRVVNVSKDITELSELQAELKEMKQLVEDYKKELEDLRIRTNPKTHLISESYEMNHVIQTARRVAKVDSTVLIHGETGVGKEVIANYIHTSSPRSDKPFIKLNCGAIPESLLESELFGYEKGAFSGAVKQKKGMFELAHGGSLFLDEIAEMSLPLQTKLLRVIQERELMRLGGTSTIQLDVRLITATHQDLLQMVNKGSFREDLYYRLNVIPIEIPALRNRTDDIVELVLYFLNQFNEKYGLTKKLSPSALDLLQSYKWPGNVRELQNIMERLVIMTDGEVIDQTIIEEYLIINRKRPSENLVVNHIIPLKECVEEAERQLLTLAQREYRSTNDIAKALQVNQSTISRKLKRLIP